MTMVLPSPHWRTDRHSVPPIKALLPMACDGVGPGYTCQMLMEAMARSGANCQLDVSRRRATVVDVRCRSAVPGLFNHLPFRLVKSVAAHRIEQLYLQDLQDGDVAYIWPGTSLKTFEEIARRGNPIVLEGINTRMADAKVVLDEVYAWEGLEPAHGITQARIDDEEAQLAMASAIFAPSEGVEQSHKHNRHYQTLPAHYGAHAAKPPRRAKDRPLTYLFVGSLGLRKGAHQLLRAWASANIEGRLILAGPVEDAVAQLCADELNRDDVEALGFVKNVGALFSQADIFLLPSFEEGDPLVTYEAASSGCAVVASFMGAGRMGTDRAFHLSVDPWQVDSIVDRMRLLASSEDMLWHYRQAALRAAKDYRWQDAGEVRIAALRHLK